MITGQQLKVQGQDATIKKANDWKELALYSLRRFVCLYPRGHGFTFDEFRDWAGPVIGDPQSVNSWGSLPRCALREGVIKETARMAKAKRPAAHARMVRVWEAA